LSAKINKRKWSCEPETNELNALTTGWNSPHKLDIVPMLITCTVQLWWLAEVCMKGAFSGEFFALLPGVEKKQQEIESANCEN